MCTVECFKLFPGNCQYGSTYVRFRTDAKFVIGHLVYWSGFLAVPCFPVTESIYRKTLGWRLVT